MLAAFFWEKQMSELAFYTLLAAEMAAIYMIIETRTIVVRNKKRERLADKARRP